MLKNQNKQKEALEINSNCILLISGKYTIKYGVDTQSLVDLYCQRLDLLDKLMKLFKRHEPHIYDGYLRASIEEGE